MLLKMAGFSFMLWQDNIPLECVCVSVSVSVYITLSVLIHPLVDTKIVSMSWLLGIILQ